MGLSPRTSRSSLPRLTTTLRFLSEVQSRLTLTQPRTRAARRLIAPPAPIADFLGQHPAEHPATDGHGFGTPKGHLLHHTGVRRRVWAAAVEASGGEPCRFHDLRHSRAALLIAYGEHPKLIQQRLGHASIKTTLDVYGHLFEGLDEAAADHLEDAFRRADVVSLRAPSPAEVLSLPHR